MRIQYELFPVDSQEMLSREKFEIRNIGYDKNYRTDYGIHPRDTYFIYRTGGINRYLKHMGPVFPYIKNEKTGNVLSMCSTSTDHYVRTNLKCEEGSGQTGKVCRIHRVAAFAFIKNPDPKKFTMVNHKDGNVLNYRLDNLEWISPSGNLKGINKLGKKYTQRQKILEMKGSIFT